MRSRAVIRGGCVAVVLALVTACAPTEPSPTQVPSPTPTYSDEELLQQARDVYEALVSAQDSMTANGQADMTLLSEFAEDTVASESSATAQHFIDAGIHTSGQRTIANLAPVEVDVLTIQFDVCLDLSDYTYLDQSGDPSSQQPVADAVPLSVNLSRDSQSRTFLVSSIGEANSGGESICAS